MSRRIRVTGDRDGCFTVDANIDVEVELTPDDMREYGYHHEDDCNAGSTERSSLDDAIDDLHRQAGHGDFPVRVCLREPCRSLYLVPAGQVPKKAVA